MKQLFPCIGLMMLFAGGATLLLGVVAHEPGGEQNDLILIMDPFYEDSTPDENRIYKHFEIGALTSTLLMAIGQKKPSLIISSPHVFKNAFGTEAMRKTFPDTFKKFESEKWKTFSSDSKHWVVLIPEHYAQEQGLDIKELEKLQTKSWSDVRNLHFENIYNELDASIPDENQKKKNKIVMDDLHILIKKLNQKPKEALWQIYATGHGTAFKKQASYTIQCGVSADDFKELLNFFNEKLKVSLLVYASCFSGGLKQAMISKQLNDLKVNFIVAGIGTTEKETSATEVNFTDFFSKGHDYFGERKIKGMFGGDPLKSIIQCACGDFVLENQPFVWIPHVGVFQALEVDKKIMMLTKSLAKAHAFEGKSIEVQGSKGREAMLIYPEHIQVPLILENFKNGALILPTPTILSQDKPAAQLKPKLCLLEEVQFDGTIEEFSKVLAKLNNSLFAKVFLIRTLKLAEKTIQNLLFLVQGLDEKQEIVAGYQIDGGGNFFTENLDTEADQEGIADILYERVNLALGNLGKPLLPDPCSFEDFVRLIDDAVDKTDDVVFEQKSLKEVLVKKQKMISSRKKTEISGEVSSERSEKVNKIKQDLINRFKGLYKKQNNDDEIEEQLRMVIAQGYGAFVIENLLSSNEPSMTNRLLVNCGHLVAKGVGLVEISNGVSEFVTKNGNVEDTVELYQKLFDKGVGFDQAIALVNKYLETANDGVIKGLVRLCRALVGKNQGFSEASKVVEKASKSKDTAVLRLTTLLRKELDKREQGK